MNSTEYSQQDNHTFTLPLPQGDGIPTSKPTRLTMLDGNGFIITNLINREECQYFMNKADNLHMERLDPDTGTALARKVDRVSVRSKDVATWLYNRIQPYLEPVNKVPNRYIEKGKWHPTGLNHDVRLVRYSCGDFFLPHHDGCERISKYHQSLLTVMVYLNDDFEGGHTRFFDESQRHYEPADMSKHRYAYKPCAGDVMIFYSQQTHDGSELLRGRKYIMRTEVMFQLDEDERPKFQSDHDDTVVSVLTKTSKRTTIYQVDSDIF